MNQSQLDINIKKLEYILDSALNMEVGLSEYEADYTLQYIAEKLALLGRYSEMLSNYSLQLGQHFLKIVQGSRSAKVLVKIKTAEFMGSTEYMQKSRGRQKPWLEGKMVPYYSAAARWDILEQSAKAVQNSLEERIQTFRRLDSQLRLHTKIIETRQSTSRGIPDTNMDRAPVPGDIDLE